MTIGTISGNPISRVRGVGRLMEAYRIGARQLRMLPTAPPPCAETAVPSPEPVPEPVAQPAPETAVPHPHTMAGSLDLAAAGAAVLANSRDLRQGLSRQPDNICVVPPTLPHLRAGLEELARAACNDEAGTSAVETDSICHEWSRVLDAVVARIACYFGWCQRPIRLPNTPLRQTG